MGKTNLRPKPNAISYGSLDLSMVVLNHLSGLYFPGSWCTLSSLSIPLPMRRLCSYNLMQDTSKP